MGKKKNKIKFIDKKQALSFHLVAKAAPSEVTSAQEQAEEQAELDWELKQQKAEQRKKAGIKEERKHADEDEEDDLGEDDEEGDESEEESFVPKPEKDDRINLLNLAAEAEGIETRAVRQAKKAAKEKQNTGQQFYLQPNFRPGQNVQLPKDFPQELLYTGEVEGAEEEYWAREDAKKRELDRQADAPSLLPHNYDYEQHLRPITGRGLFMEAKRGDEMYDAESDPRDQPVKASATASLSLTGDAVSSSNPEDEKPENPELLEAVEKYQRKLLKTGRRVKPTKDFVKALEGVETEEAFEELQDDFVMQAMAGAIGGGGAGQHPDGDSDDEEDVDGIGEYYEEGEDDEYDEDGDVIPRTLMKKPLPPPNRTYHHDEEDDEDEFDEEDGEDEEYDEDEEDDEDGPKDGMDAAFDKVLEEYDDDEIGELDHYLDENPEALEGKLDLEDVEQEMDEFLTQKEKFKSEGGSIIDKVDTDLQQLTLNKLSIVTRGEKSLQEIECEIEGMLNPPVKEQWDAESILSTYSNRENHPHILREGRNMRRKGSKASSSASDSGSTRSSIPAFQPPLPVPASILRQAKRDAGEAADGEEDVDEMDEEDEVDDEADGVGAENRGKARAIDETPEEKKRRKQAVKQAQREAKERKKALKTLYVQETAAAMAKQARMNKAQPPGVKKL